MSDELERKLIQALEDIERNKGPFWRKPGFWVSWLTVITMICGGMFFVFNLVLEKKFETFSEKRGVYATEKKITGTSLAKLQREASQRRSMLERHESALSRIEDKIDKVLDKATGN